MMLFPTIYLVLVLLHAGFDAWQRSPKRKWTIRHGWETVAYAIICALAWQITGGPWYWAGSLALTTRMALFDPAMNMFRKLPFDYNGEKGSTSLQDRLENRTGIPPMAFRVGYIIVFFANLLAYYAN